MNYTQVDQLTILGATGSIGTQTLDIVNLHSQKYGIFALTAYKNIALLASQCCQFKPVYAVVANSMQAEQLNEKLKHASCTTQVLWGQQALRDVASAPEVNTVVAAIVGSAGLLPTLAAIQASKKVLLANKEALVMAGEIFMRCVQEHKATLIPIDSEHNAIFQCLPVSCTKLHQRHISYTSFGIEKLVLTASGGPFLTVPIDKLASVTPQQACKHPNWSMGKKICVDSASMMNKGLEVIEAHWLFNVPVDKIDIVVQPESIMHAMVYYTDGSVLAQCSNPDMRTPISHALSYPQRLTNQVAALDFAAVGTLNFQGIDEKRFPCVPLVRNVIKRGGTSPAILNAANEIAVAAFLDYGVNFSFTYIPILIEKVLDNLDSRAVTSVEDVLEADKQARLYAQKLVKNKISL